MLDNEINIESPEKKKIKKGVYLLPNLITSASLFGGFYAIIASLDGNYEYAAIAIIISGILDGLDGRIARLTGSSSKFGGEYDSLADLIAFGLAPGRVQCPDNDDREQALQRPPDSGGSRACLLNRAHVLLYRKGRGDGQARNRACPRIRPRVPHDKQRALLQLQGVEPFPEDAVQATRRGYLPIDRGGSEPAHNAIPIDVRVRCLGADNDPLRQAEEDNLKNPRKGQERFEGGGAPQIGEGQWITGYGYSIRH